MVLLVWGTKFDLLSGLSTMQWHSTRDGNFEWCNTAISAAEWQMSRCPTSGVAQDVQLRGERPMRMWRSVMPDERVRLRSGSKGGEQDAELGPVDSVASGPPLRNRPEAVGSAAAAMLVDGTRSVNIPTAVPTMFTVGIVGKVREGPGSMH